MIVKIKKRDLVVLLIILLSSIPIVYAAVVSQTFYVLVTMTNRGPIITLVNISNVTPVGGNIVTIDIGFNVSDEDGFADLNDTSAKINITYRGVGRSSSSCTANDYAGTNSSLYICTITFYYFDNSSGQWNINASIGDGSSNMTYNSTWNLTVSSLSAMVIQTNLTFSGAVLGQQDKAATTALILNNTGNQDFGPVNVTAYDLVGMSDSTKYIAVGNFTVNTTDAEAGKGNQLVNKTAVTVSGSILPHKSTLLDTIGNESLYFWLDVPTSAVISAQSYNSTTLWTIIVNST